MRHRESRRRRGISEFYPDVVSLSQVRRGAYEGLRPCLFLVIRRIFERSLAPLGTTRGHGREGSVELILVCTLSFYAVQL
jgi:hypothetical protein